MSILFTDDELVAIGRLEASWPWPLMTVADEEREVAAFRGNRSLAVRGMLSSEDSISQLREIASFVRAEDLLVSALVNAQGEPDYPLGQLFIVGRGDGKWLFDTRYPEGVHEFSIIETTQVVDVLSKQLAQWSPDEADDERGFALLKIHGDEARGILLRSSVEQVRREGDVVVIESKIAENLEVNWTDIISNLLK